MPTGRNQTCPCGSGKKYKRCCLANGDDERVSNSLTKVSDSQQVLLAKNALELGDLPRAWKALEPLLAKSNVPADVLILASNVAMRSKKYERASSLMGKAVRCRPRDPYMLYNYGTALSVSGHKTEAVAAFERALVIKPDLKVVYPNLGHTLRDLGRTAEAIDCYRKAFNFIGVDTATMSQIVLSMQLFSQADHQALFAMHRQLAGVIESQNTTFAYRRVAPTKASKIRIGYLSPRFSREIVGYFFKPLFDHHDRELFEIYLYSITPRTDELTKYFEEHADSWIEVGAMSNGEICQQIVDDKIDVLVDLAGHAPENRIGVMARKPAPIQVSMIDYFDTTGLDAMDYYVTDRFSSPTSSEQQFTEELIFLKQPRLVYEAPEYAPALHISTSVDRPLVFGSFNRHHKLVPQVIATWSSLLLAVPGSRLVLKGTAFGEADSQQVFLQRFAEHEIESERIEFRGSSPHVDMFAEYGDIDIALDTFPYNGGLTTCEALWMGTPVLTLLGERIISRQTAGMLRSLGLSDFIAESEQQFVEIGCFWARHRSELLQLRQGMRERMMRASITDASSYTADFEANLVRIIESFSDPSEA